MSTDEPEIKIEVADIVGLFLHRTQHAAVFCLGDKSEILSSDSLSAVMRRTPGGVACWPTKAHRSGTVCLYEAFNAGSSDVFGQTASGGASIEFSAFLAEVIDSLPPKREFHVIADNLAAHGCLQVKDLLGGRSTVYLHFTSTYSFWLDQVEFYLARIERDLMASGPTVSVRNMRRELIEQIRRFDMAPEAVKWRHIDPAHFITTQPIYTVQ